jgi:hypothetical protein
LDAAQKAAVQAQALAVGFAATAGGDVAGLFQPGSTLPAAPITGASEVATRAEGSGAGLVGARGATAEFSVLVPFDASTAGGDVSGQALWQITMTGQADAWLADSAVLRGILP